MKCLFKVLTTLLVLPILTIIFIPVLIISIILEFSGCIKSENLLIHKLFDFQDWWRNL